MTPAEKGFLLLTSHLGSPERAPLTVAQFRTLTQRVQSMEKPKDNRNLCREDLEGLGYEQETALRILHLLEGQAELASYVQRGEKQGCVPITRVSRLYPAALRRKLGMDAPGCLWAKGNLSLLEGPFVSLVGSRELKAPNRRYAEYVGAQAAREGFTLVSGNARGADRTAQDSCLSWGGTVVSVVADELYRQHGGENILYLSEDSFDSPFTAPRALSRNRVIHCLGSVTFVAQTDLGQGGTWDGTAKNLRRGWSPVYGFPDGSAGMEELIRMGAEPLEQPAAFQSLNETNLCLEDFYE